MSNAADVIQPPGATHVKWSYGDPHYYKRTEHPHLNQVSEEWQTRVQWHWWDLQTRCWEDVGAGFCSRNLKELARKPQTASRPSV